MKGRDTTNPFKKTINGATMYAIHTIDLVCLIWKANEHKERTTFEVKAPIHIVEEMDPDGWHILYYTVEGIYGTTWNRVRIYCKLKDKIAPTPITVDVQAKELERIKREADDYG